MGLLSSFCSHYCCIILFISLFFFGILLAMEQTQSEFLLHTFQQNKGAEERVQSLQVVLGVNFALMMVFIITINCCNGKVDEAPDSTRGPEWRFASKIERPSSYV